VPLLCKRAVHDRGEGSAGQRSLSDEAAGAGHRELRTVVGGIAARGHDDTGRVVDRQQDLRYGEAVDIGKLDVEQYNLRTKPFRLQERLRSVGRRPDDGEAIGREQRGRRFPESSVIIDDQQRPAHVVIVTRFATRGIGVNPNSVGLVASDFRSLRVMGLSVVVADDHALVRDGIVSLLASTPDIEVVGTAGDLQHLLRVVDELVPNVVVTDIRMPPTHTSEGVQAATTIRERHPDVGVVVLSMYVEPDYVRTLLGDGTAGRGYLLKARVRDVDELARAIRAVAAGDSVLDSRVVDVLLSSETTSRHSLLDDLSDRERAVLAEMAAGRSNASIAEHLYMSGKTVEKHIRAIFAKLGVIEETSVNRRVVAVVTWLETNR
jgi:DNA-binding NarL/FixJ family response regulator